MNTSSQLFQLLVEKRNCPVHRCGIRVILIEFSPLARDIGKESIDSRRQPLVSAIKLFAQLFQLFGELVQLFLLFRGDLLLEFLAFYV